MNSMSIDRGNNPVTDAERTTALNRFAVIDGVIVLAFAAFLYGFFVANWFPGQPKITLIGAIVLFLIAQSLAFRVSGMWSVVKRSKAK